MAQPSPDDRPADQPSPERRVANSLLAATLLALAGGSLDAFLYLNHGHVFAGAMTGNAVLCGIALLGHDQGNALHHVLPILAFFVGVWIAESLAAHLKHDAVKAALLAEILGLLVASFLPEHFPNLLFVPWIATLAAFQIASFRQVDAYAYNSTFITGDLRTAITGLHQALTPEHREAGLRQARELGLIIVSFVAGAVGGAALASHLANRTLWLPIAALLSVLALIFRQEQSSGHTPVAQA